jgi:hypothetical protein
MFYLRVYMQLNGAKRKEDTEDTYLPPLLKLAIRNKTSGDDNFPK